MNLIIRNFWHILRKFRTTSIMVILGLAAAFTVFLTVMIQCWYDFSYNGIFKDTDDTYLYTIEYNGYQSSYIRISNEIPAMKQAYPDIIDICAINNWKNTSPFYCSVIKEDGKEVRFEDNLRIGVTNGFFSFFNPKTIAGDATKLFSEPDRIVITEKYAKKCFGNENPIGKVLKVGHLYRPHSELSLTIVAVWEDFPDNCSLKNGIYYDIGDDNEGDGCNNVFVKIKKSDQSSWNALTKRIAYGEHWSKEELALEQDYYNSRKVDMIPFDKIYFSKMGEGNLITTLSLIFVGIITLIIAYINFINFSIAIAPARVKSINIQKIFGADAGLLKFVIASESVIFSMTAFFLSVFFISLINTTDWGHALCVADMSLANNRQLLIIMGFFTTLLGFGIGLYPAYYITLFKPALNLSGSPAKSKKNVRVRNILTSVQFIVTITLITVTVFMKWQHDYAVNYSYGMEKENIVYLPLHKLNSITKDYTRVFVTELKKNPQVLDCTLSSGLIGTEYPLMNGQQPHSDIKMDFAGWRVDDNFLSFFGIPVVEGNNFLDYKSGSRDKAIVNRKLVEEYGDNDVIGKSLRNFEVIGVIDDINFEDLYHSVKPMAFVVEFSGTYEYSKYVYLKIAGNNISGTIAWIKNEVWPKFSIMPCEINFLDAHFDNLYKRENDMANLLTIVSIITIIIAIMGVYGLITFNIRQKEKEIALRKIAGATLKDILLLLNRGVLIQLGIAFIVAAPAAYYIANRWLETFAYKISIQWWVFVLCWLLMVAITVATICMQTYRAAIKNPIEALKTE